MIPITAVELLRKRPKISAVGWRATNSVILDFDVTCSIQLLARRCGPDPHVTGRWKRICGLRIRALFVPGHSVDSVIYMMELNGKRVAFTGDIGFDGTNDILNRCWGDRDKARVVMDLVRSRVISWSPDMVFRGHQAVREGTPFLRGLVERTEKSLAK